MISEGGEITTKPGKEAITVGELIEALRYVPSGFKIILEGCDCHGVCSGFEYDGEGIDPDAATKTLLLRRDDEKDFPR